MANSDNGFEIFDEVTRAISADYGWDGEEPPIEQVAIDAARLAAIAGRYATGILRPFTLAPKGARLELRRPFADPVELVPVGGDAFVGLDDGARYQVDAGAREIVRSGARGDAQKATRLADDIRVPLLELDAGRYDAALAAYDKLKRADPRSPALDEGNLNRLGFAQLIRKRDPARVIPLFRVNVSLHPDSMNTYDSLGEVYARAGDKPKAIAAFQAGLKAMGRDKTTPAPFKEQLRKNAEKRLRELSGK